MTPPDCKDLLDNREPGELPPQEDPDDGDDGDVVSPPEPTPVDPTVIPRGTIRQLICQAGGLQPQLIKGLFMTVLADHFSDARYIHNEPLRKYRWLPNNEGDIKIIVAEDFTSDETIEQPLTIVVKRHDHQFQPLGIGGRGAETVEGRAIHYMVAGAHTFIATGGNGAEAELLGQELGRMWTNETIRMVEELFFHSFFMHKIGSLGLIEELGNAVGVPVSVVYTFEWVDIQRPIMPEPKILQVDLNT